MQVDFQYFQLPEFENGFVFISLIINLRLNTLEQSKYIKIIQNYIVTLDNFIMLNEINRLHVIFQVQIMLVSTAYSTFKPRVLAIIL